MPRRKPRATKGRRPTKTRARRPAVQVVRNAHPITLTVNGKRQERRVEPRLLLVDLLRDHLKLKGVHVGCDTSQCGACTVIVGGHAVKSCTMFAVQAEGADILTIEGLGTPGRMHPLQVAFKENLGLQCGYCTPGVVLAAAALLREHPSPSEEEVRVAISGNLCRCTGYRDIVRSVLSAAGRT
ncbi:MAG TPA: (2Fe-2S)-binding protein [Thermoplasmata archaeon]|nr:(2Fe-2S)-binding protein [Thermoplasmata archaeon]